MSQVPLLSIYYVWQIAIRDTACLIGVVLNSKLLEKNVCCTCKQYRMHDNHLRLRQSSPCHLDHASEVTETCMLPKMALSRMTLPVQQLYDSH